MAVPHLRSIFPSLSPVFHPPTIKMAYNQYQQQNSGWGAGESYVQQGQQGSYYNGAVEGQQQDVRFNQSYQTVSVPVPAKRVVKTVRVVGGGGVVCRRW